MSLSYSKIQVATQCPRKYYWKYVKKLRPVDDPIDKNTGSLLHRVLAKSWTGTSLDDALQTELDSYYQELLPRYGAEAVEQRDKLARRATGYLAHYKRLGYVPPADLVAEKHHTVALPNGEQFVFVPDGYSLTDRTILEIKTGSNPEHDRFLLYSIQHYTYAYGLQLLGYAGPWSVVYLLLGARKAEVLPARPMLPAAIEYAGKWLNEWKPPESNYPNYGTQCQWCEYNLLDETELMGLPVEDVFGHYVAEENI